MIKKISMTTPTSAQIVDGYGTSTTDGYSQNYINWKLAGSNTDSGDIAIPTDATEIYIISKVPSISYIFSIKCLVSQLVDSYYLPGGWYITNNNYGGIAWQYRSSYGIRCAACNISGTDKRSDTTTYVYYR